MSFASSKSKPPTIPKDKLVKAGTVTVPKPPSFAKPVAVSLRQAMQAQARPAEKMRDAVSKLTGPAAGAPTAKVERIIDHYEIIQTLHTSQTGTEITLGVHRRTGETVVLKAVDRSKQGGKASPTATAVYHAQVDHEHVCAMHEIFDSQRLVMVIEHVPGITLDRFLIDYGCGAGEAQTIAQQLGSAIAHMHSVSVCHRNVCLQNIMLREGYRACVKLIDFGSCATAAKPLKRKMPTQAVYMSPELAAAPDDDQNGLGYAGPPVDMWAFGVVLHVMLTGKFPFVTTEEAKAGLPEKLAESVPDGAAALLRGLLTIAPDTRSTAVDATKHPWLRMAAAEDLSSGDCKDSSGASIIASGSPAAWLRARASGELPTEAAKAHDEVCQALAALGMDPEMVVSAVRNGAKNDLATSYFLLCTPRRGVLAEPAAAGAAAADAGSQSASQSASQLPTPRGEPPAPPAAAAAEPPSPSKPPAAPAPEASRDEAPFSISATDVQNGVQAIQSEVRAASEAASEAPKESAAEPAAQEPAAQELAGQEPVADRTTQQDIS